MVVQARPVGVGVCGQQNITCNGISEAREIVSRLNFDVEKDMTLKYTMRITFLFLIRKPRRNSCTGNYLRIVLPFADFLDLTPVNRLDDIGVLSKRMIREGGDTLPTLSREW